jgi:hypothetical protein
MTPIIERQFAGSAHDMAAIPLNRIVRGNCFREQGIAH